MDNSYKKKNIVILGATGSIGSSTLQILEKHQEKFSLLGISGYNNIEKLAEIIHKFSPAFVAIQSKTRENLLHKIKTHHPQPIILEGTAGLNTLATLEKAQLIICAIAGKAGLPSMIEAIKKKPTVAIANKEPLVMAGKLITELTKKYNCQLLPIDSEHSGAFQCLQSQSNSFNQLFITASGGPFRNLPKEKFSEITLQQALQHPVWKMGNKNTIDSATLMNKTLEVIEAHWLFNIPIQRISVLIHPQSIIHAIIAFKDGSHIAQMSLPDMKIPISYCLNYPDRISLDIPQFDFTLYNTLEFFLPDSNKFPTLTLPKRILALGDGVASAINGANEYLVELFIKEKIRFQDIFIALEKTMTFLEHIKNSPSYLQIIENLDDALQADNWGKNFIDTNFLNK